MSEEAYALVAFLAFLATVFGVWSAWRRRQIMKRLLRSLTPEQRRAIGLDPPDDPPQTTGN